MKGIASRLLTCTLLGAAIVGCFYGYEYLTTTDKLAVEVVEFHGLNRMNAADMQRECADLIGQNILLVSLEQYAERFTRLPRVRRADYKRVLPGTVQFTLEEREPVALLFSSGFMEVDRDGVVMNADELTEFLDLPIITGVDPATIREGRRCEAPGLNAALHALELCKRYGGSFAGDISELRASEDGISIMSLRDGVVVVLGESDFESRLRKFFVMRSTIARRDESARLIDLRFEGQIVLRSDL